MTCAGNLFFKGIQTAIFICSPKIRVNDLPMPINSAERKEADFKTKNIKKLQVKLAQWARERGYKQVRVSKRDGGELIDLLKVELDGEKVHTHQQWRKEVAIGSGNYWAAPAAETRHQSLETDQPNEQRNNKQSPKQPPSLSEHFLFLLAASTWPQSPAGAAGPGHSIWSVQSSAANRDNVEAIRCICVLMAPFSAVHSQWATAPSVHVHTVNEANSSSSQFHIQYLEISESRTCDRIAFQPTE